MQDIDKVLDFIIEIEKLKNVQRKTRPVGLDRFENSAEHSWHVCLAALMLKDSANEVIDINRVIRMLLIHDLGEIDAGDTIIYQSETPELKAKEYAGLKRLFDMLPNNQGTEFLELWLEFEAGMTPDAKYAKAIDRLPPLLHNLHGAGHSWKQHQISKEMVFKVNSRIAQGSEPLWHNLEDKLNQAASDGLMA
ncbi:HD domain-containing protein [Alginatibacterium sediminis]|uniref:HD domain-containing protein n=2 Tax=Alginatibacterium sediminis TaxID=2164068 RepID=A0A420E8J7_9ALTE|nr:HD domain-containing protein [Alginatibacterium sediminis]